jgi:hypothetical protein
MQISKTAQSATGKPKNLCKFQNYTNLPQTNPKLKEFQNLSSDEEKKLLQLE